MASKSRWTEDDEDAAESAALRKREKEAKRHAKEEKLRKSQSATNNADLFPSQPLGGDSERPSKRRKTSVESNEDVSRSTDSVDSKLLKFAAPPIKSCGSRDAYDLLNAIEEGSYGLVSRAREKSTGEVVALKKLKMEHLNDGFPVTGLREIQTLMACSHQNIVKLREVVMGAVLNDVYLAMDFLEHDLKTLLEDMAEPFLPSEIKTLMLQIVSATSYLHTNWIIHRDLKTSNILMNNRGEIKLADFGMARYTGDPPPKLTQLVVTLWYRSPELLLGTEKYGFEVDIWSLGCIFGELLTKDPVFQGKNEVDQLSKIFSLLGTPNTQTWPGFRSLPNAKALHPVLSKTQSSTTGIPASKFPHITQSGLRLLDTMLSMNPTSRPTANQILDHTYFKDNPRPKAKELFPTFPSKAGQEKRRRRVTPQAPVRGAEAPKIGQEDFAGLFKGREDEQQGAGFSLRLV